MIYLGTSGYSFLTGGTGLSSGDKLFSDAEVLSLCLEIQLS